MYRTAILRTATKPGSNVPPQSTTTTMMPWNGWFSSWLKTQLGPQRFEKVKDIFLFSKDDIHDLHGMPNPSTKVPIGDGKTAQFRYPSPGSQDPVRLPELEKGTDPYNIAYYPRDTRRAPTPIIAAVRDDYEAKPGETVLPGDLKEIEGAIAASKEEDQQSSPGNKGTFATGKSDFDPTGLRAAMSTNHAAVEESLKQYLPNGGMPAHLPTYEWEDREAEIIEWHESRGLPVPPGGRPAFLNVKRERRVAQWS